MVLICFSIIDFVNCQLGFLLFISFSSIDVGRSYCHRANRLHIVGNTFGNFDVRCSFVFDLRNFCS